MVFRIQPGNREGDPHQFDLDVLKVHATLPVGQPVLVGFTQTRTGTSTVYRAFHVDEATGRGMIGTLI